MGQHCLRFIHAAQLRLDAPLTGTGPLSREARRLAEDATLTAWQRLVDAFLEQSADFLLLTGPVFDPPPTRRGIKAFVQGCTALAEYDIDLFVTDRSIRGVDLPENVRFVADDDGVDWNRPGRSAAELRMRAAMPGQEPADENDHGATQRERPIGIGCCVEPLSAEALTEWTASDGAVDYLASSAPDALQATGGCVLHDPGPVQGLSRSETGPWGCSLVEVDGARRIEITPIVLAPIRWEAWPIDVDANSSRAELVESMQIALLDREPAVGEQLWIIEWQLSGSGSLPESLLDDAEFSRLCADVESELGGRSGPQRVHRRVIIASGDGRHPVGIEFAAELQRWSSPAWRPLQGRLIERLQQRGLDEAAAAVAEVRAETVRELAQRHTRQWGAREAEGGVNA